MTPDETPPQVLTADDFDELLDCIDVSPRLNTEQHHALHSKLVTLRKFYDSEWAAVEAELGAVEGTPQPPPSGWYCEMCDRWFKRRGDCPECGYPLRRELKGGR